MTTATQLPPALRAFADRHSLGERAVRSDGRLTLTLDQRYRVNLQAATHNRLALTAQVASLAAPGSQRADAALERVLQGAAGLLREHASTLSVDPKTGTLQLQLLVDSDSDVGRLEDAIGDFTNALAFYTRACAGEADLQGG